MTNPPLVFISLLLTLPLLACEVGDVTGSTTVSIPAASENGLSVNGLIFRASYLTRFRTQPIGVVAGKESLNGLDPVRLLLNEETSGALEESEEGRSLLKYIATCALPPEMELVVSHEGEEWAYPGLLNLAPEWATGACEEECQGWISACLLAHTNNRGAHVAISLRGSHPALAPTEEEAATYSFEEGAFYAQLFRDDPKLYACNGKDAFSAPLGTAGMWTRNCAQGQCGVDLVGTCFPLGGLGACEGDGGAYENCATEMSFFDVPRISQVITVMLDPAN
jgi:hypothetical protein